MSAQPDFELRRRRFTVAEYEHMARTGALRDDDRVELLDGEIVMMSPIGPRHSGQVIRLTQLFATQLADLAAVSVQNPLRLNQYSEPEPDVVLARPRVDFYSTAHPGPDDVLLIVEVAETSLAADRGVKVPLYAAAGIMEVWVIDVDARAMHVYRDPDGPAYREIQTLRRGDKVAPLAFPELLLELTEILG